MKNWAVAFHLFAAANGNRFPASLEEAAPHLPEGSMDGILGAFDPDRFEVVYRGAAHAIADPARAILIREKDPFHRPAADTTPEGYYKTYAFADGHTEIKRFDRPADFEAWERDRMAFTDSP
ncbi:MAG: hypothetical protein KF833_21865 [Verrucomicrobiae bacterium]|nr:hypothetical protein [Verrucomicrobiae bacterium]